MAKGGLLAILGPMAKGKGGDEPSEPDADDEEAPPSSSSGGGDAFAREAFKALQDGDEDGFVTAFKGAVRACMNGKKEY